MAKTNPTFDPSAMFAPFKMPGFDVDALIALQRRNIEAFSAANKVAADGFKAVAMRQAELTSASVDEFFNALRELLSVKDVQTGAAKQAELTKATYEKAVANFRELSDLAAKSNVEVFEVLNKRVVEGLDELKTIASKTQAAA